MDSLAEKPLAENKWQVIKVFQFSHRRVRFSVYRRGIFRAHLAKLIRPSIRVR